MKNVSLYEAKQNLLQFVELVKSGEPITIWQDGRPVALLTRIDESLSESQQKISADSLRRLRLYSFLIAGLCVIIGVIVVPALLILIHAIVVELLSI
ncbi:MAG: hypothetical protein CVV45_00725 [Spirochaetae bacterium HGW-Spirochaetae-10]|nr:MAG: hypothetical protein CVV45_00725 [Spirochaetae bacterium HGW-Spirochaetae-10]